MSLCLSREQIKAQLQKKGSAISEFSLVTEGDYAAEDALWNYLDLAHLEQIHPRIYNNITTCANKDSHVFVSTSNNFFSVVVSALVEPNRYVHYSAMALFVVVAESVFEDAQGRTRVTTTYNVGTARWLFWIHSAIRWFLRRNYRRVMEQDLPLRRRRQELRGWGYRFCEDSWRDCKSTLNTSRDNTIPPASLDSNTQNIFLDETFFSEGDRLLGRDDHWGVRLKKEGERLLILPRICPHEGASLDCAVFKKDSVQCPWHGRLLRPLAVFKLNMPERQEARTPYHAFVLEKDILSMEALSI